MSVRIAYQRWSLPAVLNAGLPATVAARRLAGLLDEATLGVAGLLGGGTAVERARLAVELAGAGGVERVRHFVLILKAAILFGYHRWLECFENIQSKCLLIALIAQTHFGKSGLLA